MCYAIEYTCNLGYFAVLLPWHRGLEMLARGHKYAYRQAIYVLHDAMLFPIVNRCNNVNRSFVRCATIICPLSCNQRMWRSGRKSCYAYSSHRRHAQDKTVLFCIVLWTELATRQDFFSSPHRILRSLDKTVSKFTVVDSSDLSPILFTPPTGTR